MKILYIDWTILARSDVLDTFHALGHETILFSLGDTVNAVGFDLEFQNRLESKIKNCHIDVVFSLNYFPPVSEAAYNTNTKYISWVFDNPLMKIYSINIINECNYIFIFDYYMYEQLRSQNVHTVYYIPLAGNPRRLSRIQKESSYNCEVSFVGALYNEHFLFYDKLISLLKKTGDMQTIGFLDGLVHTQLDIYGYNILFETLSDEVFQKTKTLKTFEQPEQVYFTSPKQLFCDYILCRKITSLDRLRILETLSTQMDTHLYTHSTDEEVGFCKLHPPVDCYDIAPKVYKSSKINLNISLRSIQTGIPLRAFEIMSSNSFLLTNFQEDFLRHFEPDKDFVFFHSLEECIDKANYYLKHDLERKKIARSGYEKMIQYHTFEIRLQEIFHIAGL